MPTVASCHYGCHEYRVLDFAGAVDATAIRAQPSHCSGGSRNNSNMDVGMAIMNSDEDDIAKYL